MDKFPSKKQRNACKRSYSSFSSGEDDDDHKKGRRLKRNKPQNLTSNYQTLNNYEHDSGEHSAHRKTKKKSKRENFNKRRKRKCDSDESSSSSTSEAEVKSKKRKKKLKKKEKRKKEHRKKDKRKKEKDRKRKDGGGLERANADLISGPMPQDQISVEEKKTRKAMVPMTKEEYEKQQSKVRRVFDPETGRNRLVKGDGEIIEEVVSYHRHKEINKLATLGDGASFEKSLGLHK